jgi:hypothetical protein
MNKEIPEEVKKKYETYKSNIEWHIKTNFANSNKNELALLDQRVSDYTEVINDLERIQQFIEPLQKELQEASEGYLKTIQSWVKLAERQAARIQELESELQELKEENDLKERQLIAATSRIKLLDEEIERLKAGDRILFELVQLKHIKDVYGKTEDYERDQPLLWEKARKYFIQSQSEVVEIDSADKKAAGDYAHETENKVAHIKTALFTGFLDGVRYERGRGGEEKMETEQQPEGKVYEVGAIHDKYLSEPLDEGDEEDQGFADYLKKRGYSLLRKQENPPIKYYDQEDRENNLSF